MLLVRTKWNRDRKRIGESPLDETQANLEDAQITAIVAIHEMAQTLMGGAIADRDQPDIQECHCKCQTR